MGTTTTLADTGVPREPASAERHFLGTFGADMADEPGETLPPAREMSTVLLHGYGDPAVLEKELTPVLADVVRMERIPADAHFLVTLCAPPVVAKWALVGRWKPQEIRVRSLAYVRFEGR
ncbi:hypothetical protein [Streptomyces sp. NPDC002553]|uniref:hypothetical protein n=1 Tax=unclassified Streptomyces TaxID=2593676 RepID=UPI00331C17E4